ncbi:hypothetical protein ACHAXT_003642 [Thalassiosira profunda]
MGFLAAFLAPGCILALFLPTCGAFAPTCANFANPGRSDTRAVHLDEDHWWRAHHVHKLSSLHLNAVSKRQTLIMDGAELAYYVKSQAQTEDGAEVATLPDVAPRARKKRDRVGAMTFVVATLEEDLEEDGAVWLQSGLKIIGVEASSTSTETSDDARGIVSIGDGLQLYRDSIAVIPAKLSPADAISTAATCLLGVHCSSAPMEEKGKRRVVIVGGGEYALFLAKALVGLGHKVFLVTARPSWSLPSAAEISHDDEDLIEIMPPAVGTMSLGFATAIGEFDTLIDTLGDEMGAGRAMSLLDHDAVGSGRFLHQLTELHGCKHYVSTLTRSQQYVLKKGLLFARDPVVRYQNEVEKSTSKYQELPPPSTFGATIQRLLDQNIVYSAAQNENGSHHAKPNFVRGWSLSDLTELKTWPREGPARLGFPVVDLSVSTVAARRQVTAAKSTNQVKSSESADGDTQQPSSSKVETDEEASNKYNMTQLMTTPKSKANATITITKKRTSSNPYVTTIRSASELNSNIVEPKHHCILFVTAAYCQKCKRMTPQFNRIARISSESHPGVVFAHLDITNGPRGKQLGTILKADKVPSVILFRSGDLVDMNGDGAPLVVERSNMKQLEKVAEVLDGDQSAANLKALLAVEAVRT